jgi:hypothetical protein
MFWKEIFSFRKGQADVLKKKISFSKGQADVLEKKKQL